MTRFSEDAAGTIDRKRNILTLKRQVRARRRHIGRIEDSQKRPKGLLEPFLFLKINLDESFPCSGAEQMVLIIYVTTSASVTTLNEKRKYTSHITHPLIDAPVMWFVGRFVWTWPMWREHKRWASLTPVPGFKALKVKLGSFHSQSRSF